MNARKCQMRECLHLHTSVAFVIRGSSVTVRLRRFAARVCIFSHVVRALVMSTEQDEDCVKLWLAGSNRHRNARIIA